MNQNPKPPPPSQPIYQSPVPPPASGSAGPTPPGGRLSKQMLVVIIVVIGIVAGALVGLLYWWNNVRTVDIVDPVTQQTEQTGVRSTTKDYPTTSPTPTKTATPTPTPDDATLDHDQDGYSPAQGDCDDYDLAVNPGVSEVCDDWIDNDCDGYVDENCFVSTSWSPDVFDYTPYFLYSDEYIYDWYTMDSDFDGVDEVLAVGYSPSEDIYHAFIVDWDEILGVYMMDYEQTFVPPFAYITASDWDGDGWDDFVIAFVADSGDGYAIIYDQDHDVYQEYYSDF